MRRINKIILHCSATRPEWMESQPIEAKRAEIERWHLARGWRAIGYHWLIDRDGAVIAGRPEAQEGAHVTGQNATSVGVCLIGGFGSNGDDLPADHFTPHQMDALRDLMGDLLSRYPGAMVRGHNDYAAKACPGFRVALHLAEILPASPPAARPPMQRIEDVRALQAALLSLGYTPGPIDGLWGDRTMAAARAFLTRYRITQIAAAPKPPLFAAVQVAITAADAA